MSYCTDCLSFPWCHYYVLFWLPSLLFSTLMYSTFSCVDWVEDLCLCCAQMSHRARSQVSFKVPSRHLSFLPISPTLFFPLQYTQFFPLQSTTAITPCLPQVATALSPHRTSSFLLTHCIMPRTVLWIPT